MGSLTLVTAPAEEPVSVLEALDYLRLDEADETALGRRLRTARKYVEQVVLERALLAQTWDWFMDGFPSCFQVPKPPLTSVTHIKYYDTDGTLQTLAANQYTVDLASTPGRIVLAYNVTSWPAIRALPNAVQVRFVAGVASPDLVDDEIKDAIMILAGTLNEHREDILVGEDFTELPTVHRLLASYRMYGSVAP